MKMSTIKIPTVLWTNNKNSVLRKYDPERDATRVEDFIDAMLLSAKFVLEKKGRVDHMKNTITKISKQLCLNEKETTKLNELIKYIE